MTNADAMPLTDGGDRRLSGMDRKLWGLVYGSIAMFGVPVMFKRSGPDVPKRQDMRIEFFVPKGAENTARAVAYLRDALASEIRTDPQPGPRDKDDWNWNVSVSIMTVNDVPVFHPMSKDVIEEFLRESGLAVEGAAGRSP